MKNKVKPRVNWKKAQKSPPGKFLEEVKNQMYPRVAQLKVVARAAYEAAPIGGEAEAVWRVIKKKRKLESGDVFEVMRALPSKRVGDQIWHLYYPTYKRREEDAERREVARRRRVLKASTKEKP